MAKFVQIIEYQTGKFDEMDKLADEFRAATEGKRTVSHVTVGKSRDAENRYFTVAEFASYEDAMKNNDLPETAKFAAAMSQLADGPPTFHNIDVVRDEDF
jgi:quinol monooxygenase YgiN